MARSKSAKATAKIMSAGEAATPSLAERTKWFVHDRFGMFIHWGLYAIPARGEWVRTREQYEDEAYHAYLSRFNPVRYDPKAWAALVRAAGQKYVVMTAKHHDGFCLFDSALTDWKATRTPYGRDLIRPYVEAFRAEGLKVGFYYSLLDWDHPDYPVDSRHPRRDDPQAKASPHDFSRYVDYLHGQVRELLTNYGRIDVMWFDFSYDNMSGETWRATELVKMVRSLQPHILIDNRLVAGHEQIGKGASLGDFASPEQIIPPEGVVDPEGRPVVWESCITINDNWGYHRGDRNFKSPAQIIRMLVECVSKGGNLLLNVGPTALGEIQPEFAERLAAVGRWMEYNGDSVYGCGRAGWPKPEWGYFTQKGDTVYAHILHKPVGAIPLLGMGEKVRRATLLRDGSEVSLRRPWNAAGQAQHAFLTISGAELPDPIDTVVALEMDARPA